LNRAWRGDVFALAGLYDLAQADFQQVINAAGDKVEKARLTEWHDRIAALTGPCKWRLRYFPCQQGSQPPAPEKWTEMLANEPLATADAGALHFAWRTAPPADGVPPDYFALVAETELESDGGAYDVALWADDGARLFVDGKLVLESWKVRPTAARTAKKVELLAGKHALKVEFFKATGDARLTLALTPRR
jgi:hypothetical protein